MSRTAPWEGADLPPAAYRWGIVLLSALGAALRVAHLTRPFNRLMAWNEGHYAMIALNFDRYGLWSQRNELGVDRTMSPGVTWLMWASFKLFGPAEWAARLPMVIAGIIAIVLVAAFARRLMRSEQVALIAAAFVAVAPGLIYYSQNVQLDTPAICCALAAAVLMLRYRQTRRRTDAVWAGVWLAVAVWFKFTTILLYPAFLALWWPVRPRGLARAAAAAGGFAALTALPSFLWIVSGWPAFRTSSGFTNRFFFRDWDLRGIAKALSEIPLVVEVHLFIPIFLLLLAAIPAMVRWRGWFREIWIWSIPLVVLYIFAPWDSLVNRYYDLPATYLLTIPAAVALWRLGNRPGAAGSGALETGGRQAAGTGPAGAAAGRPGEGRPVPARPAFPRRMSAALAIVLALTVAYDLWDPMTDRIARATMPHAAPIDPSPFYSAKIIAALPPGRTVVDTPQTMFYAGGDSAWFFVTGGDVRWKIDGEDFDYVVLNDYAHGQEPYYAIDEPLRAELARHRYVQIAPAAWAHVRTAIADLGGYRDPSVPAWSPAPLRR